MDAATNMGKGKAALFFHMLCESKTVIILFFLLMFAIRLIYLDADPSFVKRMGDLADEGIWVHGARSLVLFDNPSPDQANQSWSVSPLHTLLMSLSFYLFGVGLYQARLVSALAGWVTLLALYFFLRRHWGKRHAFFGVFILVLNDTFLIYNKLALGVTLPEMFILLAFFVWYKGAKNKFFYFLSGASFALAILSKLSAYYFAPVFAALWILQWYRKEAGISALFMFGFGGFILLIPYAGFLMNNWDVLSVNFMVLYNSYNSGGRLVLNIFRSFSNNLFGLPSMFLLTVLTTLYFLKKNRFRELKKMDFAELAGVCWLVVGFVSLVILSDLSDRRFFGLLIPLSILSTKLYIENNTKNGGVDFNALVLRAQEILRVRENSLKEFWMKVLSSVLWSYPISAFFISSGMLYFCRPISSCKSYGAYFILFFFLVSVIFLIALHAIRGNFKKYFIHFFTLTSILLLLLLPLFTLLRHFSGHLSFITSTLDKEVMYIIASSSFALAIMAVYIFLTFRYSALLFLKPNFIKRLFIFYFLVSGVLIGLSLAKPSFTLAESSRDLISLGEVEVGGAYELLLSVNAFFLPINLVEGFKVNEKHDPTSISYFFATENSDGVSKMSVSKSGSGFLLTENDYATSKLIKKVYLFPYPFTEKYRTVIDIYEVNGYKQK